jgi:N-acetylneuraminic acid mutarotase
MDTRAIQRLLACLGVLLLSAGAGAAEVTNVQAAQYGSFVYVRYDLLGSESELTGTTINLQLSRDGGATFPDSASTLFGDYGADSSPGTGKYILWDAYADYPEAFVPEAALWVKLATEDADNLDAGTTPPESAASPFFTLDTRLPTLDADGDSEPDDRFDASQNGAFDVLDDFDADGLPDAFEDNNGDFIPDAYADANGNQIADGFEDANQDNIPDFFANRYAVYSPTHPRSDRTYFAANFRAEWPNYYPAAPGYYWVVDQDPDTVVDDGDTYLPANALRAIEHTVSVTGTYYFHLAAMAAENVLIVGSQVTYEINVALESPEITSSTHPNGASAARTFTAQATAPPLGGPQWKVTTDPSFARGDHTSLAFNNKLWVIGGQEGSLRNDVWSSPDGETWTQVIAAAPWTARSGHTSVVFDNQMWVIGGFDSGYRDDVWSSIDGETWTQVTAAAPWSARYGHTSVVFNNRLWVIGGSYRGGPRGGVAYLNDVWSSPDGVSWTRATDAAPWEARTDHSSVAFDNRLWVIGSPGNDVWSSADGVNWTQATAAAPWSRRLNHTTVVFNNQIWVIGGFRYWSPPGLSDVWSSPDGVNWTQATAAAPWSARWSHTSVVFNSQLWVISGFGHTGSHNDVWSTTDGVNWTQPTHASTSWSSRHGLTSVVFNNQLWVIGGFDSVYRDDIWSSPDGETWQTVAAEYGGDRAGHTSVVFNNKLWIIGGDTSFIQPAVLSSSDGVTWTSGGADPKWAELYGHTSVVFNDQLWVIGGADGNLRNQVWSSPDGSSWTPISTAAPWTARRRHTSVVFNNQMWVIGGYDGNNRNDVWSSPDGMTWTQVSAAAPWTARSGHTSVVFDNQMWVIGGHDGNYRNDLWSSIDGDTWTQVTSAAPWTARSRHTSVVFNRKLWIMGGDSGTDRNDVWSYGGESTQAWAPSGFYYQLDRSPTTRPNTSSPFSATPDFSFPCNAPGDHWFHGVAVDSMGNHSPAAHYRFEVLDTAPTVSSPTHPEQDMPLAGLEVSLAWDDGGLPNVVRYHYALDDQPEGQPNTATTESSITFDCVPQGVHWFHVQSEDACGFLSRVSHRRITVGPTPGPVVLSSTHPDSGQAYAGRDVALNWTVSEDLSGPFHYVWDRVPFTMPDEGTPITSETGLPVFENQALGGHFLYVYGVDRCGALTSSTLFRVHIREAMPPVITLAPDSSKSSMTFTWTDPDDFAKGTPKFYYAFDDFASTEPGPGAAATDDMQHVESNVPDGLHYFHVRAQDRHGNLSPVAHYAVNGGDTLVGLSAPSRTVTSTASVDYWVTYPGATHVSLVTADVTLNKPSYANGTVNVSGTADPLKKRIRISNFVNDGTFSISIAAGSAQFPGGVSAPAIGPSETFLVDNSPPHIAITGPTPSETSTGPVVWTVTYTGAQDILLLPQDVTLSKSGTANGIVSLAGVGNTRTITLSNITGDGEIRAIVAPYTATDAAGNRADGRRGDWVNVDNTRPLIHLSGPSAAFSNGEAIAYTVTYTGADSISLSPKDVSLVTTRDATGAVAVTGTGNSSRTVSIVRPSGYGTIGIRIAPGTATKTAGGSARASGPSEVFSVAHRRVHMMVYGRGTTTPAEGVHLYTGVGRVTLIATPNEGAKFLGWEIDGIAIPTPQTTITMNQNHAVRADFTRGPHSADQDGDHTISLSELLRVIQFYNSAAYGCQPDTEDGYAPDAPGQDCTPHANDYNPQDWRIKLTEMLRTIQFYNRGGYTPCPEGEDGFCPAT